MPKINFLIFLLRKKGVRYTYNFIHFTLFYGTRNHFLMKLLYWLEPYPPYLEVEVTTKCNLRCVICEHTYWNEPERDMSFEDFKKIVDEFPKLKWIGLTGIGESFLNKDFLKMLYYVKSRNIFVELYDTFFFIDDKVARELIKMGVDKIFASIDAATKETYERIRLGSNFDRVIQNVKHLAELKSEMKAYFPRIGFHFVVNKLNLHEMPKYVQLVHELTPKEHCSIQFSRMLHNFEEIKGLFAEVPEDMIRKTEKGARELGIEIFWNTDVPKFKSSLTQCTEWIMPFIFVTGHVIPCCAGNEAGHRDFQKKTALGNVFEEKFTTIWHNEKYKNLRKMLRQGKAPLACKNCCLYEVKDVVPKDPVK